MPSSAGPTSVAQRSRPISVAALVFLVLSLPALLAAGEIGLGPGLRWAASIALMTAFVISFAGRGRALGLAVGALVALFVLANTALALSFVLQGKPFNDAFFAHLDATTLAMAWRTDALRLATMAVYVLAAPVAIHLLAARAGGVADRLARLHVVPKLGVLGLSLLLSYPLAALADYRIAKAEASDRLLAEIARVRAEPPAATVAAAAPRNLVLIYLESVEETFFDETLFPGLMPNLTRLRAEEAVSFGQMRQYPGTGWTIAAMVASQCGVPLLSEMWGNDILTTVGNPFARVTCLGEHLRASGYRTAFVGGATLDFAGKGNFLRDNGFDIRLGLDELPNTGAHKWGLYDVDTFAHARDLFDGMAEGGAPFLLSVLTLDTHFPDGMPSPGCRPYAEDALLMLDAVHCADQLVAEFVAHVRASPAGAETVIAIMSDHLFMEGEVEEMLDKGVRRPFFLLLDPERPAARVPGPFTHFDVAPTLLDAVGLPGVRFAFGHSLLAHDRGLAIERNLTAEDFEPFTIESLTEVAYRR